MSGKIRIPQVRQTKDPIIYDFGHYLWSGLDVSYRTGDEYDLFTSGWFDYTPSIEYNSVYQHITSWSVLGHNNVFGNTTRFTNTSGGAAATSGNRAFIDNLTGLMWYIPNNFASSATINWNDNVDLCNGFSFDGFSDWYMPPFKVWLSISNYNLSTNVTNYNPFSINAQQFSSTTVKATTTNALIFQNQASGIVTNGAKTTLYRSGVCVRRWIP